MNQAHGHAGPPPTKNSFNQLASRPPPPIPVQSITKAKAMWNYNENNAVSPLSSSAFLKNLLMNFNQISTDLVFYVGDIIEITDDKNPDWWTGRLNGREGLFPASYVEKLARNVPQLPARNHSPNTVDAKPPMPPSFPNAGGPPPSGPNYGAPTPYQPQYSQQNSYYAPPPQNGPYPPYQGGHNGPPPPSGPPPSTVAAPPQENQEQSGKKHGLFSGKLGNTVNFVFGSSTCWPSLI